MPSPACGLDVIVEWRVADAVRQASQQSGTPTIDQPQSAASKADTRLTEAKAEKAEIELQRLRGELVHREAVHTGLGRVAHGLRALTEQLERDYGPDAARALTETLDEMERQTDTLFGRPNVSDGEGGDLDDDGQ